MKPFTRGKLLDVFEANNQKLKDYINKYSDDEIMANDIDLLAENCYEALKMENISIGTEDMSMRSVQQTKINKMLSEFDRHFYGHEYVTVDGAMLKFYYTFQGDSSLLHYQPSTFTLSYPEIGIEGRYIVFEYSMPLSELSSDNDKKSLENRLNSDLSVIRNNIGYISNDIKSYNNKLKEYAINILNSRKKNLEKFYSISKMFEVPIERKNTEVQSTISITRRILPTAKNYSSESKYYCIREDDYKGILSMIKHQGSTFERTPYTFRNMNEEDLRTVILSSLNGVYSGKANAEAFRNKGKTDICIEYENRAAFVAECKMWTGKSGVLKAITQLDGYLTWRDCKTALLFFSRNKDFLTTISSLKEALTKSDGINDFIELDTNEFECKYASKTNQGQVIRIRIMIFNLYTSEKN